MSWLDGTPLAAIPGAVAAGLVAGALLPLLGVWVVMQRVVFLGVALAQVAAAGVAVGMILDLPPLATGLAATLLVVSLVARGSASGRPGAAGDGTLGALFCASSALALLFVSNSPADLDEVAHVLHGNLIYASTDEVRLTALVLLGGVALVGLFRRPILFAVFDAETAMALGLPARRWLMLLLGVLAVVLSTCMRTTGSLLSFAMLVLPPLAALSLGRGLAGTFVAASLLGLVATAAGLALAVAADLHVESAITVCLAAWLPITAGWRRHPALGIATLVLTLAAGLALVHSRAAEPTDAAHPFHHGDEDREAEAAWHADVALTAERAGDGGLTVSWTVDLSRRDGQAALPDALWIVLTGDGVFHDHELVHDLTLLPVGRSSHRGSCLIPARHDVHRVEGQLWTGPPLLPDSEPLGPEFGDVIGTEVR